VFNFLGLVKFKVEVLEWILAPFQIPCSLTQRVLTLVGTYGGGIGFMELGEKDEI